MVEVMDLESWSLLNMAIGSSEVSKMKDAKLNAWRLQHMGKIKISCLERRNHSSESRVWWPLCEMGKTMAAISEVNEIYGLASLESMRHMGSCLLVVEHPWRNLYGFSHKARMYAIPIDVKENPKWLRR